MGGGLFIMHIHVGFVSKVQCRFCLFLCFVFLSRVPVFWGGLVFAITEAFMVLVEGVYVVGWAGCARRSFVWI